MESSEQTYNQAIEELERILSQLRSDNCDVDTLAERTRRAAQLLKECRQRLTATEEELAAVLASIEGE
jgi:exodeoxyribonuclease VII small subunit